MVNAASNNLALQKTIAACLLTTASNNRGLPAGSVRWNDVFITSVLPVPSAANSQAREAEREAVLSSPSPSLAVTYTVLSYHATVNNTELANALQESVNSGAFDVQLRQSAASEGATALALASSETLTVNALPDVVDDVSDGNGNGGGGGGGGGGSGGGGGGGGIEDGSGGAGDGAGEPVVASTGEASTSSQNLSGSALIGVIIGGVSVLLLVCAGVVYYLFYSASAGKGATLVTQTSPRTVVAVTYGGVDEVKQCCAVVVEANCSGHAV